MTLALLCVACALVCWTDGPSRMPVPLGPVAVSRDGSSVRPFLWGTVVTGAVLLIWPSSFVQAVLAGLVAVGLTRWDSRRRAAAPVRVRGEVAVVCDLWAACLEAGMPTGGALAAALEVSGRRGPSGDPTVRRLAQVAGLLRVGADVHRAWQPADGDPWLEPVAAAARRSHHAGAELAAAVRDQGRAVRRAEAGADDRRAERAGVLMTAPLTLCFLPAFICLGLAPVVIALIGTLDLGR